MQSVSRHGLLNVTLGVVLVSVLGWWLVIGQTFLLPILVALISVYIMGAMNDALGRMPGIKLLPSILRRFVLALVFVGVLMLFASLITNTVYQLSEQMPKYQRNVEAIAERLALWWGFDVGPTWAQIQELTLGRIDVQAWLTSFASQVGSLGGFIFLIIIYIVFLLGEKAHFPTKLAVAYPEAGRANQTRKIINAINQSIGQYLATKTLINVILGVLSYIALLAFGVDYAAFWALLIGLLNYIPYIGSIIALVLPVALSIVQFGSWPITIGLYAVLQTLQVVIGNFVEPKLVGKKVNLSAFVVLAALALWTMVWGLAGAILAVPLTSMLIIIFKEIPAMRPLAVFMSNDPATFLEDHE